jgi:hypothetical protein
MQTDAPMTTSILMNRNVAARIWRIAALSVASERDSHSGDCTNSCNMVIRIKAKKKKKKMKKT